MTRYPWEMPVCDPRKPIRDYNFTEFEKCIQTDSFWKEVFDDDTGFIVGYVRHSGGFTQVVDRHGKVTFQDEISIEVPWFSPVDIIGGGGNVAAKKTATSVARVFTRLGTRGGRKSIAEALEKALVKMRTVASAIRNAVIRQSPQQVAKSLVQQLRKSVSKVKVDIGGTGKVKDAINLNPLTAQQTKGVPNLVKGKGEQISELFPAGSIDEIVSSNIVHGTVNWTKTLVGSFRVLKPGGRVSIAPFAGNVTAHVREITAALEAAGFKRIRVIAGKMIEAAR